MVFCLGFFSFFCLFWAFFALGAGCRAALFSAGLFRVVFCLGFFCFVVFFWAFFALGAGRRAAFFFVGLFRVVFCLGSTIAQNKKRPKKGPTFEKT